MSKAKVKSKKIIKKTKVKAKKILSPVKVYEAFGDKQFFTSDGKAIANLKDLPGILGEMDEATYEYHVNSDKNDFSNWIGEVFLNDKLAKKIEKTTNREAMIKTLQKELG